ncbi:MAG: transcriptional repressor NrdR [Armatimonadota bacterium]|nr:MAG: transcriptional repressor NrdR [Armatimonadota bacterium]
MKCPYCGHQEDRVLDSRTVKDGESIKRRRECLRCQGRFNTFEEIEERQLVVIKKDQGREPFDRRKILRGMSTACEKRPVSTEDLERAVDEIEMVFRSRPTREVSSREIGELVIEKLRELDQVAFVRFASVYWEFEDVEQFKEVVNALSSRRSRSRRATEEGEQDTDEEPSSRDRHSPVPGA